MAKRKRLTPAASSGAPAPAPALARAPIAQVAGEASASAALGEMSEALHRARTEGRLIEPLPLAAIDEAHLMRDRLVQDEGEMETLVASIAARGQQTPIEVVALPAPKDGKTHGLVSGWRRLTALRHLHETTFEDRFATVQARIIAPDDAQAAYVAMVEENEIRAGLSLYEKGRITLRAVHAGLYPTPRAALRGLFGSVSRSRRSKIGSFLTLVEPLDSRLRFPAQIPEKLGLGLARALEDYRFATALKLALQTEPHDTPEAELELLNRVLHDWTPPPDPDMPPAAPVRPASPPSPPPGRGPRITGTDPESVARRLAETRVDARFDAESGRITLTGGGVDAALFKAMQDWLKTRRS